MRDAPVGWEVDPSFVYIGRSGKGHDGYFGNPLRLQAGAPRGSTLIKYRAYLEDRLLKDDEFKRKLAELRDKTLICFCHPEPCHGHVIAEYLDQV